MKQRIVAIHQPNFFPWLGFFHKLATCDVFVILDDAQIQKTSGSWVNRVRVISGGESRWFTAPIKHTKGVQNLNEVEFADENWREKFKKTLQTNYAKCEYFKKYRDQIFEMIDFPSEELATYNTNVVWRLAWLLGIDDFLEKVRFSSLMKIESTGTQRLFDIAKKVCCNAYMTGTGAVDYIEETIFHPKEVVLIYQNFEHPVYEQANTKEFVPGLSIIDYIFNVGTKLYYE